MEVGFLLIIRSLFYQVAIPSSEEYALFSNDYVCDAGGNVITDSNRSDVYQYGDLIIQTSHAKYIFKKVYCAYDYAVRIMECIKNKYRQGESVIYIDMADLNEFWDDHAGTFEVEMLNH